MLTCTPQMCLDEQEAGRMQEKGDLIGETTMITVRRGSRFTCIYTETMRCLWLSGASGFAICTIHHACSTILDKR